DEGGLRDPHQSPLLRLRAATPARRDRGRHRRAGRRDRRAAGGVGGMSDAFEQKWLSDLPSEWVEKRADFLCDPYRITVDPADYEDDLVVHYSIPQVQETGGPAIEPASDIGSTKLLVNEPMLLVSKLIPRKQTICIAEPHEEYVTLASSEF